MNYIHWCNYPGSIQLGSIQPGAPERPDLDLLPDIFGNIGIAGKPCVHRRPVGEFDDAGRSHHAPLLIQDGSPDDHAAVRLHGASPNQMSLARRHPALKGAFIDAVMGNDQELHLLISSRNWQLVPRKSGYRRSRPKGNRAGPAQPMNQPVSRETNRLCDGMSALPERLLSPDGSKAVEGRCDE